MERFAGQARAEIARRAGLEVEVEKRWQIKKLPENLAPGVEIEQAPIVDGNGVMLRIRKMSDPMTGQTKHYLTSKHYVQGDFATEATTEITPQMYQILLDKHSVKGKFQRKTRYNYKGFTIDEVLEGTKRGQIILEKEFHFRKDRVNDDLPLPPELEVIE